jgi:hypothetical protein
MCGDSPPPAIIIQLRSELRRLPLRLDRQGLACPPELRLGRPRYEQALQDGAARKTSRQLPALRALMLLRSGVNDKGVARDHLNRASLEMAAVGRGSVLRGLQLLERRGQGFGDLPTWNPVGHWAQLRV